MLPSKRVIFDLENYLSYNLPNEITVATYGGTSLLDN
jgi:hypothetical protein